MKASGGLISPDATNSDLFAMQQRLEGLNSQNIKDAQSMSEKRKEQDKQSSNQMAGFLKKAIAIAAAPATGGTSLALLGNDMIPTGNSGTMYAADGGLVQNYAAGGGTVWNAYDRDNPLKDLMINRILKGKNVEDSNYQPDSRAGIAGKFYTDMVDTVASMPSIAVQGLYEEGKGVGKWLFGSLKEEKAKTAKEAAQKLAAKQEAAPKTTGAAGEEDFMQKVRDQGGLLPPPVESKAPTETSSAITDAVQNSVNPTIQDTQSNNGLNISQLYQKFIESQTKTEPKTWMDNVNIPLVKAGAAMAASNKPFLGAIAEGMDAGATSIEKERQGKESSKNAAQKLAQDLMDSMVNAQYRNDQIRLGNQKASISDRAVKVQEQQLKNNQDKTVLNQRKALDFARKQAESEIKSYMLTPDGITATPDKINAMRESLQKKYYDNYMNGSFNDNWVVSDLPSDVKSDLSDTSENTGGMLDFNQLAVKYAR
jgi:hypothetical protein